MDNVTHPFQVWCCNTELYERGEKMGMSKAFTKSKDAVQFYKDSIEMCGNKVVFEFRHYSNPKLPGSFKIL